MSENLKAEIRDLKRELAELRQEIAGLPIRIPTGGGGGSSNFEIYSETTLAALPDVDEPAIGQVTAGADKNYYSREGDASTGTWVPYLRFD